MEQQLDKLVAQYETADPLKEVENNLLIKQDLTQQLNMTESMMIEKQRQVKNLTTVINHDGVQFFAFIDNLSITSFSDKLQSLVIEKGDLLRKFHPESIKVFRVEEQIQNTYAFLKAEVSTYLSEQENQERILEEKVTSLKSRLKKINSRNITLHGLSISYDRIKKDLGLMQNSYTTLMTRWEETKIQSASDTNTLSLVSVSSKPYFSGSPIFPNKKTLIPVGILVGIITGLSLGFLLEYFDQRIKRPEDVRQFLGKPTLFSVPHK